jgi:hypothetical protein
VGKTGSLGREQVERRLQLWLTSMVCFPALLLACYGILVKPPADLSLLSWKMG